MDHVVSPNIEKNLPKQQSIEELTVTKKHEAHEARRTKCDSKNREFLKQFV